RCAWRDASTAIAAGLVMPRFSSHALSAAAASAKSARCLVMERNLPRVVGDGVPFAGSNAAVGLSGSTSARYERVLIVGSRWLAFRGREPPAAEYSCIYTCILDRPPFLKRTAMTASTMTAPRFPRAAGVAVAAWVDIATALLALVLVAAGEPRTALGRGLTHAWNAFGLLDLVVAVGTATVVTIRGTTPGIAAVLSLPLVVVPTFFVPILLANHVVIFRRLLAASGTSHDA